MPERRKADQSTWTLKKILDIHWRVQNTSFPHKVVFSALSLTFFQLPGFSCLFLSAPCFCSSCCFCQFFLIFLESFLCSKTFSSVHCPEMRVCVCVCVDVHLNIIYIIFFKCLGPACVRHATYPLLLFRYVWVTQWPKGGTENAEVIKDKVSSDYKQ